MAKLAMAGGTPLRTKPFPSWPVPTERELEELKKVLESGKWGIGSPAITEFERRFAQLHDAKYALMVANGTVSLWVALKACDLKAGDEVIIPPYTFMATAVAVLLANATPVFVDIDPQTYNIDPTKIEEAITDRTKVVIPVHIAGMPANMDEVDRIAKARGLKVIEDAAQAHLASWKGRRVGAIGDIGSFSFQSSKNMTSGEGGMVTSDSEELVEKCFSFSNCGRVRKGQWYEHRKTGANHRPGAFQAAVLTAQLDTCEEETRHREEMGRYLDSRFADVPGIEPQLRLPEVTTHAYHLYVFRYDKAAFDGVPRSHFLKAMNAEGIPCSSGYVPLYKEEFMQPDPEEYPWLEGRDYAGMCLPACERACYEEGCWMYQSTLLAEQEDMDQIADAVMKIRENLPELKKAAAEE